jgi:hypothetical protein
MGLNIVSCMLIVQVPALSAYGMLSKCFQVSMSSVLQVKTPVSVRRDAYAPCRELDNRIMFSSDPVYHHMWSTYGISHMGTYIWDITYITHGNIHMGYHTYHTWETISLA